MEDWLTTIQPEIKEKHIHDAFNSVEDFAIINLIREIDDRREALNIMMSALGVDQEKLQVIRKRFTQLSDSDIGTGLLGILIGLKIGECIREDS